MMNAYVGYRILDKRKTINTTNTKAPAAVMIANAYLFNLYKNFV